MFYTHFCFIFLIITSYKTPAYQYIKDQPYNIPPGSSSGGGGVTRTPDYDTRIMSYNNKISYTFDIDNFPSYEFLRK